MPFRAIVGHRHVVDLLRRAVARDSLPPSLIFAGPEGVGKRRVALALAQALNCTRRSASATAGVPGPAGRPSESVVDACGECPACRRIERGTHPDVLLVDEKGIHPEVLEFDVKERSAIINVDLARAVIKVAGYRPYEGRQRVVIIDPADAMERPAQNALLKVLEETPPATRFVLITARPDVLYATIRSRCPQIRFGGLTAAEIVQVLVRERGFGQNDAQASAIVAGGSVARALEAASADSTDARSQALALLKEASAAQDGRLLDAMKTALGLEKSSGGAPAADREQVALSLGALSSLLRDVTILGARGPATTLANADLRRDLEQIAPSFGRARLMRAFAAVDRALAALHANANPKIVVDWLAFQI